MEEQEITYQNRRTRRVDAETFPELSDQKFLIWLKLLTYKVDNRLPPVRLNLIRKQQKFLTLSGGP